MRLSGLPPRIGYAPDDTKAADKHRRLTLQSKTWLKSKWWLKTRQRVLIRDLYTCRMCKIVCGGKGQAHVDHVTPHNEDYDAFHCDDDGLQTLCASCHNSKKQAEEIRARQRR